VLGLVDQISHRRTEVDPPAGETAIDWTLLTKEPVRTFADAKTRRATTILTPDYVKVLSLWRYREIREDLTVHDFF
jgi:hypothetical protein